MKKGKKGFTLVEVMVAMSIFIIVLVIASGSIISIFDANQKSKNLRSVMDNLNLAMESMTRTIRFGTNYHCGSNNDLTVPQDCGGAGEDNLTVRAVDGTQVTFKLVGGKIVRTIAGVNYDITSPDANITNLTFWVYGSPAYNNGADLFQPQVIMVIQGKVGSKAISQSSYNLETTISQRSFDLQ